MFPNGWPGRGLLLLRLLVGILLIHDGVFALLGAPQWEGIITESLLVAAGMMLILGFRTPIAGILVAIVQLWLAHSTGTLRHSVTLATLGAALAMLGPGVTSLDARRFGRKRIPIRDR
jgi:hypothetical protein